MMMLSLPALSAISTASAKLTDFVTEDIERILNSQIYLELWVKVKENWSSRENLIDEFVYRS